VTRQGGFAPAAKALGISTSSVSRKVVSLEDLLGAQLLNRTTRHLSLTTEGVDVLDRCERIVSEYVDLVRENRRETETPGGALRVTMPSFMASVLSQHFVARFAAATPGVELDILVDDRVVNLVEEGFDVAIRVGQLGDSNLLSRRIEDLRLAIVGAPDYLDRCGTPATPRDLRNHNCIVDTVSPYRDRWPLGTGNASRRYRVRGNITVNSGSAARDLAAGGAGLAMLPDHLVYRDIEARRLVSVLGDFIANQGGIYVVYPRARHPSPTVARFIEQLLEHSRPLSRFRARTGVRWRP
jgi:DNA-binding transcriptional LysR family regulator